jgi:hypothetical protein
MFPCLPERTALFREYHAIESSESDDVGVGYQLPSSFVELQPMEFPLLPPEELVEGICFVDTKQQQGPWPCSCIHSECLYENGICTPLARNSNSNSSYVAVYVLIEKGKGLNEEGVVG